jgi:hypothetical protein
MVRRWLVELGRAEVEREPTMREAIIRQRLAETRAELERVEAEYRVLRAPTRDYERWLAVIGMPIHETTAEPAGQMIGTAPISAAVNEPDSPPPGDHFSRSELLSSGEAGDAKGASAEPEAALERVPDAVPSDEARRREVAVVTGSGTQINHGADATSGSSLQSASEDVSSGPPEPARKAEPEPTSVTSARFRRLQR